MSGLSSFFYNKNKLEPHKRVCENKEFCNVIMPSEDTKILEFNQYQTENSSATKVSGHSPSGFSMCTISSFRSIENKHHVYRGKDCMEKFFEFVREYAMKIINFKTKKMKLLSKEQQESYNNVKICYICKEKFDINI